MTKKSAMEEEIKQLQKQMGGLVKTIVDLKSKVDKLEKSLKKILIMILKLTRLNALLQSAKRETTAFGEEESSVFFMIKSMIFISA